tara:strand:+ start:176 stop:412 length:237 start_codon:yes stop_codon:yes gene_type:complete
MIGYFINYIMLGVVFAFVVDMATEYARRKGVEVPDSSEWNWETRILAIWIWPIGLIFFLNGFFKSYFNNNNKGNKNER